MVVGAGLAGLMAAREVTRAGKSVILLEARDRVGGRILNHSIGGGEVIEVGGQWIGPTQNRMFGLARKLGVKTFKTYNKGDNIYYRNGTRTPFASSGPLGPIPPDPTGAPEAAKAILQLDEMAKEIPRDRPWKGGKAAQYDGKTFETWKNENTLTPGGRFLLDVGIEAVFAAEPRDLSLLFVLFYIMSAGDEGTPGTFERLINTAGGAQESRFVGGSQRIAIELARRLGRRVVLDAPVRRIVQRDGRVKVESDRFTAVGREVIVAMAPAMTAQIDFDPPLPALRAGLTQRYPNGSVIKCQAVYRRPFWRDAGLTGQAVSDRGPVKITFDNSPPDGRPGVMLGFIEGQEARVWSRRSKRARRNAVLDNFATYFGEQARNPSDYVDMDWSQEQWTRGCYAGIGPPGMLLDYGRAIRKRVGHVHWAGTETSPIWNGYMEGAVRSGERAAKEALRRL